MITDLIKEFILDLALIRNGLRPGAVNIVTDFSRFDHFFDKVTDLVYMFRYLIQDLPLVRVSRFSRADPFQTTDVADKKILVSDGRRQDMTGSQFTHYSTFNLDLLNIFFQF